MERFGVELEALPEQPFRVKSELRDASRSGSYRTGELASPRSEGKTLRIIDNRAP